MKILQLGDKGKDVELWQKFVGVKPDSDFGKKTESATKFFQASVGLRDDGIVGDATLNAAKEKGFNLVEIAIIGSPGIGQATAHIASSLADRGIIILVSAGHSTVPPKDSGAVGNGYVEAKEALRLRDAVAAKLRAKGITVIEDGDDGISEPLKKALVLAKRADVAVEIHFNAGAGNATGIEVLAKPRLKGLSQKLAKAINQATGIVLRGESGYKRDDSGQHHRLAFCEAGGAVVEVCFISNADDMRRYNKNFERVAENLANALAQ